MTAVAVALVHTTRVIPEARLSILNGQCRYWAACGCQWHSGEFLSWTVARAYGQRHEQAHRSAA